MIARQLAIVLSFVLSLLAVAPALAATPLRIVAQRTDALTARVVSSRPIYKHDFEAQTRSPAITSGSGITRAGWWLFAAQDDSTLVAAKGTDGSLETIRIFPSVDGADRFTEAAGNKRLKPDLEAALTVPVDAQTAVRLGVDPRRRSAVEAVLLVGSGSKAGLRDRIALIFPTEPVSASHVVAVHADAFYAALRREPALTGSGGELNVEGAALVRGGRYLRVFNRGNGRKGSVAGSIDVPFAGFLAYLLRAARDRAAPFALPVERARVYDLGRAPDGEIVGITDAIALPKLPRAPRGLAGEIQLLSVIAEHASTATSDGYTSDSGIAISLPNGRLLDAPILGAPGVEGLKIEGLTVVSARWVGRPVQLQILLLGVTDSDATSPDEPSTLARIEVTFTPRS